MPESTKKNRGKGATGKSANTPKSARKGPRKDPKKQPRKESVQIPIVAIGASAGGLEPYEKFFDAMPVSSGIAFVIIQHLSPDFESMMDELLSRHSSMDIKRVVDDLPIRPNTIYLNPPRAEMVVENGRFKLNKQKNSQLLNLPIDIFFDSLAHTYGTRAIAVILSGTGSDGTRGAETIKAKGGTVLVQTPSSAKFDGMPRSVIESGNYDAIGTPSELPEIIDLVRRGESIDKYHEDNVPEDPVLNIFHRLRDKFGTDFGYYKDATIRRRFERRAQLSGVDLETYAQRLRFDHDEMDSLYSDMLIDVTSFFRDIEGFEALKKHGISKIAPLMSIDYQVRVWCPGCASGEEAYSLAIAFAEYAKDNDVPLNIKILATDVHQRSLGMASEGIYARSSLAGLSDAQIERYFDKNVDYYQVKQELRRLVVFSQHNLLRDPPFTRIDLLTCRNVLIYFKEAAQEKTLALFHFALNVGGILFLGPSESLGKIEDEFTMLDRRWKLYQKTRDVRLLEATSLLPRNSNRRVQNDTSANYLSSRKGQAQQFQKSHNDALDAMLREYAPPGFLLNRSGEIVHVFGSAGRYVQVEGGVFSNKIIDLIDPQMRAAITTGMERLTLADKLEYERRVPISDDDGGMKSVIVGLRALPGVSGKATHFLLTLDDVVEGVPRRIAEVSEIFGTSSASELLQQRINDLERDLTATEESLQAMVEELQTSNEELQATNEELMASNEELQSTNEELHSVNEELYTVSAEHQRKIDELTILSDDMKHLLSATFIGIIFLDDTFRIRRFTPSASAAFNLMATDIGRPFEHITYRFEGIDLNERIRYVRASDEIEEYEIEIADAWYMLRILPYTTSVRDASGVVLTLVDISELKKAELERLSSKEIFETIVSDMSDSLLRLDLNSREILMCNAAFANTHGHTTDELVGTQLDDLVGEKRARAVVKEARDRADSGVYTNVETIRDFRGDERIISRHIRVINDKDEQPEIIQSTEQDITDRHRYMQALEALVRIGDDAGAEFETTLKNILDVGSTYLQMPHGIISRVKDGEYVIDQIRSQPDADFSADNSLKSVETLSAHLPGNFSVLAVEDMNNPPFKSKSSADRFGVKSYIGVRTKTRDATAGAISFISPKPRDMPFSELEQTMVQLLARMVGLVAENHQQVLALKVRGGELESVNERLNRFAYLASHDLQEPLRKIQQCSDILFTENIKQLDEEGAYFLKIITESSARMRKLVNDLLLYSSSANQVITREPVNLVDLIKGVKTELSETLKSKSATMSLRKLPTVMCDPAVMRQVFYNILGNSLKYAEADVPPDIVIAAKQQGDHIVLSVKDNGIGMDLSGTVDVFEPFTRLHSKTEYEGSGIGLAICRSICDSHNWSIAAKSENGDGTEILINIPVGDVVK